MTKHPYIAILITGHKFSFEHGSQDMKKVLKYIKGQVGYTDQKNVSYNTTYVVAVEKYYPESGLPLP